jgi:Skp family chaperone for outer membrane proteins
MLRPLFVLLTLLTVQPLAQAKIYKYVDAQGNVVYSQTKPKGAKTTEVKTRTRSVSPEEARKQLDALRDKADNTRKNRELLDKGKDDADALTKREERNCAQARKNLELLVNSPRVQATDTQGKLFFLDEAGIKAKKDETNAQITEFCK